MSLDAAPVTQTPTDDAQTEPDERSSGASSDPERFVSPGFLGLLVTQFLTAMNDNVFRWLAVSFAKQAIAPSTALAVGLVCFTVPYLVLSNVAGFLGDRFSKRQVVVWCKFAEIVLMAMGAGAILSGSVTLLFVVVALMGAQSALLSPAKLGALPEIVRGDRLSVANGVMGLCTIVACAVGFVVGNVLFDRIGQPTFETVTFTGLMPATATILGVAVVGWLGSLLVVTPPAADPSRAFPVNPVGETGRQLEVLWNHGQLFRVVLGIAYFWFLASLAQTTIDPYGIEVLRGGQTEVGVLGGVLVLGVAAGCLIAGLSAGKAVELGQVPLAAFGIVVGAIGLYWVGSGANLPEVVSGAAVESAMSSGAFRWSCFWLVVLGLSAGLFDVPLETALQYRSPADQRGTILAAGNFVAFTFVLLSAGLFYLLREVVGLDASRIFLVAGLGTIPVLAYALFALPDAWIRCVFWLGMKLGYKVRVVGLENVPKEGGALVVANHVSWLDGPIVLYVCDRHIRFLVYGDFFGKGFLGYLLSTYNCLPIRTNKPKEMMRSLQDAREELKNGELVGIFAEGQLSRTGQTQTFQQGLMRILKGTSVPIVPVYLDGFWGSIYSFSGGAFFTSRSGPWPRELIVNFGEPIEEHLPPAQIRQRVLELGSESVIRRKDRSMIPQRLFLRQCKSASGRAKVADPSGLELTGGKLLTGALVFRALLKKHLAADEKHVGLLVPPSVGGVLANAAVSLCGRVSVNLNYTLDEKTVNFCIREAGLKHVLTSKRFMEKRPMNLDAELLYLEDLKEQATGLQKAVAAFQAYAMPSAVLERVLGLTSIDPDDLLTIIFTSGSTGTPKGVMLSHHNVGSNIEGVQQVLQFTEDDVLCGVLPFFHSFGYTVGLWLTLTCNPKTVYHFNPLDGRTVGKLAEKHGISLLVATPTFLRTYLKRCTKEQFHRLRLCVVGAEKLPNDLANAFQEKFGVLPQEGYGTTELAPAAALNIPDFTDEKVVQVGSKLGTVGRPIPGVSAKIVDPDTGADLGTDADGLLLVKGPNVMKGYLNLPDKTAEVVRDGWYDTGDVARIDEHGFITITGRQSRFSKIGGEMVPHIRIEEILGRIVDAADTASGEESEDEAPPQLVAVTSVADDKKGERLIVLHVPLPLSVDELLQKFDEEDVPNLWRPGRESFLEVEAIPILGTGKLDLAGVKRVAEERTAPANA